MRHRDALYYIMTGEVFDGRKAAEMGLVNEAVPLADLKARVRAIADVLLEKNPVTLKAAKDTFKRVRNMPWDASDDYIYAKLEQMLLLDKIARPQRGPEAVPRRQDLPPASAPTRND